MRAQWWLSLGVCLVGALASAQEAQPTVVPFPLEVKAIGVAEKDQAELQAAWRKLLRAKALVPDTGTVDAALKETGRRDCEREDECLKALAKKADSLYGVYGNVGQDLTKTKVVATGRVVRDDGKRMGEIRTTTVDIGADGFVPAAKVALGKLVEYLEVGTLSPVRPADEPVAVTPMVPEVGPPPVVTAQPVDTTGGKVAGVVLIAGGVAVAVTGIALLGSAAVDNEALQFDAQGRIGAEMTTENVAKAKSLGVRRGLGGVFTGVGAAATVAGLVVFLVSSGSENKFAVGGAPVEGGFVASVGGSF